MLTKRGGSHEFSEVYSIFRVSGYEGDPEQFLKHGAAIASLLKSEDAELDAADLRGEPILDAKLLVQRFRRFDLRSRNIDDLKLRLRKHVAGGPDIRC